MRNKVRIHGLIQSQFSDKILDTGTNVQYTVQVMQNMELQSGQNTELISQVIVGSGFTTLESRYAGLKWQVGCNDCGQNLAHQGGCAFCPVCGWSDCGG